jgi:hypothetical protein
MKTGEPYIQQNLDTIRKWENQYLMRFNPDKCKILQITTRRTTLQYKNTIQGQVLNNVNSAKILGLNIHKNFHWDNYAEGTQYLLLL